MLGAITRREWAALAAIGFMLVGLLTGSLHKVAPAWLGFSVLAGLLLFGTLDRQELKEKVDWTFLLYLSGVSGIVAAFHHLGLDGQLGAALPAMGSMMREHFALFVLVLFALVNLIRLAVPSNATTVIMATILMPLAQQSGVNEWLIGFLILLFSDGWFFPYQCSYYLQLQQLNRTDYLYDEARFLRFNAALNSARLLAAWAALPYWTMLGIL
jgi:di/tricarboxylate transporter